MQIYPYIGGVAGLLLGAGLVNPNFTKRRSWYMRKINCFLFSLLGWNLGQRYVDDHTTFMMLGMYDYLPLEIKRALQDKDYRHLALYDPEEEAKSRQLYEPQTGKSFS